MGGVGGERREGGQREWTEGLYCVLFHKGFVEIADWLHKWRSRKKEFGYPEPRKHQGVNHTTTGGSSGNTGVLPWSGRGRGTLLRAVGLRFLEWPRA